MRGHKKAADVITENCPFAITWITYMELLKGARDKAELKDIISEISRLKIKVLQASPEQSTLAITIMRDYHLRNSLDIADAINAAIAISTGSELLSANTKHYSMINGFRFVEFQP